MRPTVLRRTIFSGLWKKVTGAEGRTQPPGNPTPDAGSPNFVREHEKSSVAKSIEKIKGVVGGQVSKLQMNTAQIATAIEELAASPQFFDQLRGDPEVQKVFDQLCEIVWESEQHLKNRPMMFQLFWVSSRTGHFARHYPSEVYFDYFERQLEVMSMAEVTRVLSLVTNHSQNSTLNDSQTRQLEYLLESIRNVVVQAVETKSPDFFYLVNILTSFRSLKSSDTDFFERVENFLAQNMLPFAPQKVLYLLEYLTDKNVQAQSPDADKRLQTLATFCEGNLAHFQQEDLFKVAMTLLKSYYHFQGPELQKVIEKILERLAGLDIMALDPQKLVDLALLTKGRISTSKFIRFLNKVEDTLHVHLSQVQTANLVDALFVAKELDVRMAFYNTFFDKIKKEVGSLDLEHLLKAVFLFKDEVGGDRIVQAALQKVASSLKEATREGGVFVPPAKIFPFAFYLAPQMPPELTQLYEEYIQKHKNKLDFHGLSIVLWSLFKKIPISRQTAAVLLEQFANLLAAAFQPEEYLKVQGQSRDSKAAPVSLPSAWEATTLVTTLCNFDYKQQDKIVGKILTSSALMLSDLLEDMDDSEFMAIFRLYFEHRENFDEFIGAVGGFLDLLIGRVTSNLPELPPKQCLLFLESISKNTETRDRYQGTVNKLFEKVMMHAVETQNPTPPAPGSPKSDPKEED